MVQLFKSNSNLDLYTYRYLGTYQGDISFYLETNWQQGMMGLSPT